MAYATVVEIILNEENASLSLLFFLSSQMNVSSKEREAQMLSGLNDWKQRSPALREEIQKRKGFYVKSCLVFSVSNHPDPRVP